MMEHERHLGDALQLLLDERLPSERRTAVEAHVRDCGRCQRELNALRRVRTVVREALPEHPVPPALSARVATALAEEAIGGAGRSRRQVGRRRLAAIGLSLAALALLTVVLARPGRQDFVEQAALDLARYRTARLALEIETGDPQVLERFFAQGRTPFAIRVFDFGMMGYRLTGGRVHQVAGRVSALFAYEGRDRTRLVCQMYQGALSELPPGADEREHDGIRFRIYRTAGLTVVFWQEGSLVCVLIADSDPEAAVELAYAKAEKV